MDVTWTYYGEDNVITDCYINGIKAECRDGMWQIPDVAALRAENERLKASLAEADGDKYAMAMKIRDLQVKLFATQPYEPVLARNPLCPHGAGFDCYQCHSDAYREHLGLVPLCPHDNPRGECGVCVAEASDEVFESMCGVNSVARGEVIVCSTPPSEEAQRQVMEAAGLCHACGEKTSHVPNGMWCRGKAWAKP